MQMPTDQQVQKRKMFPVGKHSV